MPEGKHRRSGKTPEDKQRDEIVTLAIKAYGESPEEMESYFPELADKLKEFITPAKSPSRIETIGSSPLTEKEKQFRLDALRSALNRFRGGATASKEEAVKVLEDAAALGEDSRIFKRDILSAVLEPLNLSLHPEESTSVIFLKGKRVHHTYSLIRGITLSLTRDGKLIRMDLDAKDLKHRHTTLSIIGIGSDTATDVAENHDTYLAEILDERYH